MSLVTASNQALYSILRHSPEQAVLVLVNLSGETIKDYRLSLETSPLAEGSYTAHGILGEGPFAPLSVSTGGAFADYIPFPEIPPYATVILQLSNR